MSDNGTSSPSPTAAIKDGHARKRQPLSLAWRLTLTYACTTCLILLAATALMYVQLVASLKHENTAYLNEQLRDLRSDLREPLATPAAIQREVDSNTPSEGDVFPTYLRIMNADGTIVAQTAGMADLLPSSQFPYVNPADPTASHSKTNPPAGNRHFHVASTVIGGMGANHYIAQMALDLTEEDKLLTQYRLRAGVILLPALLVSMLVGYLLAHGGLRPLRRIVRSVRRVQTTTLDQRVDDTGFPGELSKLADSFNAMLERIEDAFSRLSRFSADIAHELRTPLGCIRGELEVALNKARTPEEYRDVIASCLEESVRLSKLIDKLLFLARAERQEAILRRETLDLRHEFENVREFYEAISTEAHVALRVNVAQDASANVDRTLLQSALTNLLDNALAHTPAGGSITLSAAPSNGSMHIEVADTGCGISVKHLPFVLDRFYRVDDARSRRGGNAGLGLAIVKTIATLHGGEVQITSELEKGTKVTLVIPAHDSIDHEFPAVSR